MIKYCLIGCVGASLDCGIFSLFVFLTEINYQYVNIFSTSVGIINNFFLNYWLNFKVRDHLFYRLISFYAVGTVGIGITAVLLYVGIEIFKIPSIITKVITIFVVTCVQFMLNKFVTFRKGKKQKCSQT